MMTHRILNLIHADSDLNKDSSKKPKIMNKHKKFLFNLRPTVMTLKV